MTPNPYLWLIPILPLAGAAINGFFGRQSSKRAITAVALTFCGAAFAVALFIAFRFSSEAAPYYFDLAHWLRSGDFHVDFSFYLDQLSLVMMLVVTGVGFLIHIYSVGYMWDDGAGQELSDDVHWLGGRRPGIVSADRILVPQRFRRVRREKSIHR
jgi:NADH-quinone oxidoreductase subunit L